MEAWDKQKQELYAKMEDAVPQAIATGNTDEIERLIKEGAPVGNLEDLDYINFDYALHDLIHGYENNENLRSVVKLILQHGATPNEKNLSSLEEALKKEFPDQKLIELLVNYGAADINTALFNQGKKYGDYEFKLKLYEHEAKKQTEYAKQQKNCLEIIKFLVNAGANPYIQPRGSNIYSPRQDFALFAKDYPELQKIVDLYWTKRHKDQEIFALTKNIVKEEAFKGKAADITNIVGSYLQPEQDWYENQITGK